MLRKAIDNVRNLEVTLTGGYVITVFLCTAYVLELAKGDVTP